jgi:hypothetical protein
LGNSEDSCWHNEACWGIEGVLWTYGCPSCGRVGRGSTLKLAKEAFVGEESQAAIWVRSRLGHFPSVGRDQDAERQQLR